MTAQPRIYSQTMSESADPALSLANRAPGCMLLQGLISG